MPALAPLAVLVAHFLFEIGALLRARSLAMARVVPAAVAIGLIYSASQAIPAGIRGYAPVAQSIPVAHNEVTLISADSFGEGAFVVARLMSDRHQQGVVLRASKVLSDSDWQGTAYRLRTKTPDEVYDYLQDLPVHYIVLNKVLIPGNPSLKDQRLLRDAIDAHPNDFQLVGHFPIYHGSKKFDLAVDIYRNAAARGRVPSSIRVDLGHTLGRAFTVPLEEAE